MDNLLDWLRAYDNLTLDDVPQERRLKQKVRQLAVEDPHGFWEGLKAIEVEERDLLSYAYEILGEQADPWLPALTREYDRIIAWAEADPNPELILECLFELGNLHVEDPANRRRWMQHLLHHLHHPQVEIQRSVLYTVSDFWEESDVEGMPELIQALQVFRTSGDWRLRVNSFQMLKEMGQLAQGDKLTWLDRLRAKNI